MNRKIKTWLHHNLFLTWYHTAFTLFAIGFLVVTIPPIFNWAFWDATFIGRGPEACTQGGACWIFIEMRFNQFIYAFTRAICSGALILHICLV